MVPEAVVFERRRVESESHHQSTLFSKLLTSWVCKKNVRKWFFKIILRWKLRCSHVMQQKGAAACEGIYTHYYLGWNLLNPCQLPPMPPSLLPLKQISCQCTCMDIGFCTFTHSPTHLSFNNTRASQRKFYFWGPIFIIPPPFFAL